MTGRIPPDPAGLSGRALLEAMLRGDLPAPPFATTMRIRAVEVGEGRIVFEGDPAADFLNPLGTIHGGRTAAILDSAMACAVHTLLKPGQAHTTTAMTVNSARALAAGSGTVRCEGTALHVGGRLATAEGRLLDARGRLVAYGSETCMIMQGSPSA